MKPHGDLSCISILPWCGLVEQLQRQIVKYEYPKVVTGCVSAQHELLDEMTQLPMMPIDASCQLPTGEWWIPVIRRTKQSPRSQKTHHIPSRRNVNQIHIVVLFYCHLTPILKTLSCSEGHFFSLLAKTTQSDLKDVRWKHLGITRHVDIYELSIYFFGTASNMKHGVPSLSTLLSV